MFNKLFRELFYKNNKITKQRDFEWERFQKTAKEQFLKLRRMGISIQVITL